MLGYTPSHLSHCNNLLPNLVQTWGVKMCTDAAVSLDTCTTGPQMRLFLAAWFVYTCLPVWKESGGHLSSRTVIRYSTWYDMMIRVQLWDGPVWKMWWQSKRKTRLWSDIWGGGGETLCMWERKVRREGEWVERNEGGRGKEWQEEWCS